MNKALRAFHYLLVLAGSIGSTQAVSAQEDQESKKHHEIRYKMTISTTPAAEQKCEPSVFFEYFQKDTVAVVNSTLWIHAAGQAQGREQRNAVAGVSRDLATR